MNFSTPSLPSSLSVPEGVLAALALHRVRKYICNLEFAEARQVLQHLPASISSTRDAQYLLTVIHAQLGDHESALALCSNLIAELATPGLLLQKGNSLKALGLPDQATAAYKAAIALQSHYGDAYWSLANLKVYHFSDAYIAHMQHMESSPESTSENKCFLAFALGKAFENRQDYALSWHYYQRANSGKRARIGYHREQLNQRIDATLNALPAEYFRSRNHWGSPRQGPIFVVGLPRSGSTLVEQILSSHSAIEGTSELPEIPRLALDLLGQVRSHSSDEYVRQFASLSEADCYNNGERYLNAVQAYRKTEKVFFIDKMPNNFRYIGLIRVVLPHARIIDVRRAPISCCLSNFKQLYANGQEFTYDLQDIAHYYTRYLDLMRHWDQVLPHAVHRVIYEDLVNDPESVTRGLLRYCGVPFEEACLRFHETTRAVNTPSSEQVRQPIFLDGINAWRAYDQWLTPLRNALGSAIDTYRF